MTWSTSRAMVLSMTLMMPRVCAPCCLANLIAANVSAVSPLCEIAMTRSSLLINGSLYLNSEAISLRVGIFVSFSKRYLAM